MLGLIRRGPDEVNWVPPALGFGNHLYMWLHAWKRQQAGIRSRILFHDSMRPWLEVIPALKALTVARHEVKLIDRRLVFWGQAYGVDFARGEIEAFINQCLLSSQPLQNALTQARRNLRPGALVVNVRRGDYYSVPEFLRNYGMNCKLYVEIAARDVAAQTNITGIRVVSDDPRWCRENLGALRQYGPIDFGSESRTPLGDFATLVAGENLILANSTFSYWAGYTNSILYPKDKSSIWVPRFHARSYNNGHAWQIDPKWNAIENLPGGWGPPGA